MVSSAKISANIYTKFYMVSEFALMKNVAYAFARKSTKCFCGLCRFSCHNTKQIEVD